MRSASSEGSLASGEQAGWCACTHASHGFSKGKSPLLPWLLAIGKAFKVHSTRNVLLVRHIPHRTKDVRFVFCSMLQRLVGRMSPALRIAGQERQLQSLR